MASGSAHARKGRGGPEGPPLSPLPSASSAIPWRLAPQRMSPPLRRATLTIHEGTSDFRSHFQRPLMPSSPSGATSAREPKSESNPLSSRALKLLERNEMQRAARIIFVFRICHGFVYRAHGEGRHSPLVPTLRVGTHTPPLRGTDRSARPDMPADRHPSPCPCRSGGTSAKRGGEVHYAGRSS